MLNAADYKKIDIKTLKKFEKRISFKDSTEVSFIKFSNNTSSDNVGTQIEFRREVNIKKF